MNTGRPSTPGFFWQGVLILLPVAVLAGAGVLSLRQDRLLAHHEAVERAQALAEESADVLWAKLTARESLDQFKDHTFRVDNQGNLLFPPSAPLLPVPEVLDVSGLDEGQRTLWLAIQSARFESGSDSNVLANCREFLQLVPPNAFAAAAQFRLAQLLAATGQSVEAAEAFLIVRVRFAEARGESGLPLGALAELKALELMAGSADTNAQAAALNSFCSNLVTKPNFVTASLLGRAAELQSAAKLRNIVEPWQKEWERQEPLRVLAEAARKEWARQSRPDPQPSRSARLSPDISSVPALSWFEALDLAATPQPVFPYPRVVHSIGTRPRGARAHAKNTFRVAMPETNPSSLTDEHTSESPGPTFLPGARRDWLATRIDDAQGWQWIVCRAMGLVGGNRDSTIGSPAWSELRNALPSMPAWFGATVELAGIPLLTTNDLQGVVYTPVGKGSGQAWLKSAATARHEVLATARRLENGIERLRINVHLVSPDLLFSRQRTRTYLFGFLIATSALAALAGFVSARRAYLRQQQLGEMKSNFVSSVSHELRAPIASVRLMAESLERGRIAEPAKQNEYFRFIVQECRRLSSLIENVLDFARIEQGRKHYEFEPTDVTALVAKTVQLLEPVAAEKRVTIEFQPADRTGTSFPAPLLDGGAVQQALINLLDNAVKHSPSGSTVTIGLDLYSADGELPAVRPQLVSTSAAVPVEGDRVPVERRGEGGNLASNHSSSAVRLWVQDHGPGVPLSERLRIFERFYRPGSELRRETQGVGIGLSIVKHIVEAHGGRVWVENEPAQGSRFIIELPLEPRGSKSDHLP